jgi:probable rRNA maturation factor
VITIQQRPTVRGRVNPGTLRRRATKLLEALGVAEADLAIVLTDDEEIEELNAQWRQKDAPTDVLSFPQNEPFAKLGPGAVLGDIVISLDTAARQIDEDGMLPRLQPVVGDGPWTLLDEVTFLLVHGTLHLIGHDHHEPGETERMESAEAELLPKLLRRRPQSAAP